MGWFEVEGAPGMAWMKGRDRGARRLGAPLTPRVRTASHFDFRAFCNGANRPIPVTFEADKILSRNQPVAPPTTLSTDDSPLQR